MKCCSLKFFLSTFEGVAELFFFFQCSGTPFHAVHFISVILINFVLFLLISPTHLYETCFCHSHTGSAQSCTPVATSGSWPGSLAQPSQVPVLVRKWATVPRSLQTGQSGRSRACRRPAGSATGDPVSRGKGRDSWEATGAGRPPACLPPTRLDLHIAQQDTKSQWSGDRPISQGKQPVLRPDLLEHHCHVCRSRYNVLIVLFFHTPVWEMQRPPLAL